MSIQPKYKRLAQAVGAAVLVSSAGAQAATFEADVNAYYRASAYGIHNKDVNAQTDKETGLSHLLRLGVDFENKETGIKLFTSADIAGERWQGDRYNYDGNQHYNNTVRNSDVRLDTAYVVVPVSERGKINVGRQKTSFNNCFLVCDGRRDRVSYHHALTPTLTGIINYDRKQDKDAFNRIDNGDLIYVGVLGKINNLDVGFINFNYFDNYEGEPGATGTNEESPYSLSGMHMISTYIGGHVTEDIKLTLGLNYNNDGKVRPSNAIDYTNDGKNFNKASFATYLRAEADYGRVGLGLQYVATIDGGLISPGFDSYSSLINNSPDATASPTSMYRMGGESGLRKADDQLIAAKVSYQATEKVTLGAALGNLNIKRANSANSTHSDDSMFYDLSASMQANNFLRVWGTLGLLEKNKVGQLAGNPHIADSEGNKIVGGFDTKPVVAASINMELSF